MLVTLDCSEDYAHGSDERSIVDNLPSDTPAAALRKLHGTSILISSLVKWSSEIDCFPIVYVCFRGEREKITIIIEGIFDAPSNDFMIDLEGQLIRRNLERLQAEEEKEKLLLKMSEMKEKYGPMCL